jgi:hypothetical protein
LLNDDFGFPCTISMTFDGGLRDFNGATGDFTGT